MLTPVSKNCRQKTTFCALATATLVVVVISSCSTSDLRRLPHNTLEESNNVATYSGLIGIEKKLPAGPSDNLPNELAEQGIRNLANGELVNANQKFNQALMFQPANSNLQWLNGVAYHLRALQGEYAQFEMAREAYSLSIRFDPSNWMAHYQLGLLYLDMNDYGAAQNAFAEVLLFRPDDPDLLYQMLYVSYHNYDPETAAAALAQLRDLEPDSERTLKAAPLIMASLGERAQAEQDLARFQAANLDSRHSARLDRRVQDWDSFYSYNAQAKYTTASIQASGAAQYPADSGSGKLPEPAPPELENEMIVVDVAIIQSEEDLGTRKGVNLLKGLRVQYGLDRITSDRRVTTRVGDAAPSILDTYTRTITKAISIPQLDYSLNIFNSASFKNEVLARPTLVALNGQRSRFFAGSNVQAAATASSTIGAVTGGEAVEIDEDIGVDLSITPTLRDDGRVRIDVEITRTFLENPSTSINYQYILQTAKTHVTASVVMGFGETLILSGLSERETETFRDGVPILQDIPLLQYFFSEEVTLDFQKSVLLLITPRRPQTFNAASYEVQQTGANAGQHALVQLKNRYDAWFKPAPHWISVIQHLEESGLYREFRTGDLELEIWSATQAFRKRFGDVMEFLYY